MTPHLRVLLSILLLTSFAAGAIDASPWTGQCIAVSDGDAISVMRDGVRQAIRLHGIDAPERSQPYGTDAKHAVADACLGQMVEIRPIGIDSNGRTVAWVVLQDGRNLNVHLVGQGLAWWHKQDAPEDTVLGDAEAQARQQRAGLWSDPSPVPPWEFAKSSLKAPVPAALPVQSATTPATTYTDRTPAPTPTTTHPVTPPRPAPAGNANDVYITPTGKKYHSVRCHTLEEVKTPISKAAAQSQGYGPCGVCKPR